MSVMDPLVARFARAQLAAAARAAELRLLVPRVAAQLFERGAARVSLFGSLATHAPPHAGTDIDLCVEGLEARVVEDVAFDFFEATGQPLDLVRWEDASPRLRARIAADGVEVARVPG